MKVLVRVLAASRTSLRGSSIANRWKPSPPLAPRVPPKGPRPPAPSARSRPERRPSTPPAQLPNCPDARANAPRNRVVQEVSDQGGYTGIGRDPGEERMGDGHDRSAHSIGWKAFVDRPRECVASPFVDQRQRVSRRPLHPAMTEMSGDDLGRSVHAGRHSGDLVESCGRPGVEMVTAKLADEVGVDVERRRNPHA